MSDILKPIGSREFEQVRDRLGLILAQELATQAQLDYDDDLFTLPNVYIERFKPFNHTEMPAINVMVAQGEYDIETQPDQQSTWTFYVDAYVKALAKPGTRGDEMAAKKLHRLIGMCQAILMDSRFKTLLFTPGSIGNRSVKRVQMADPTKAMDATNSIMARMTVEVRLVDDVELVDTIPLATYATIAKMSSTGEGYLFGGTSTFTPDTGCADSELSINGVFLSNIPSGEEFNLIVVDTLGNEVGEAYGNTVIVPTAECEAVDVTVNGAAFDSGPSGGTVNVPILDQDNNVTGVIEPGPLVRVQVVPSTIVYTRPEPTGQVETYKDYDDGWRVINNVDPHNNGANGLRTALVKGKKWLLRRDNIWGHRFRYCGLTGGYFDPDTGQYYDVTGSVVATKIEAFPFNFQRDHFTGLQTPLSANDSNLPWDKDVDGDPKDIFDDLAEINAGTSSWLTDPDGNDDWFLPNNNQLPTILNYGYIYGGLGSSAFPNALPPFDLMTNSLKFTSTTWQAIDSRVHTYLQTNQGGLAQKRSAGRYVPFRIWATNT